MEMIDYGSTFYERLQFLIQLKNVKKINFYEECNILKANISKWKQGTEPTLNNFFKIARYFNVSPYFLVDGTTFISEEKYSSDKIYERIMSGLQNIYEGKDEVQFYYPIRELSLKDGPFLEQVKYLLETWKYGVSYPKYEELVFISNKLGCSLEYLMSGENIMRNDNRKSLLLDSYNKLSEDEKKIVLTVINGLKSISLCSEYFEQKQKFEEK